MLPNDGVITVTITTPASEGAEPPTSQVAAITNVYPVLPPDPTPDGGGDDGGAMPATGLDGSSASLYAALGALLLLAGAVLIRRRRGDLVGRELSPQE